MTGSEEKDLKEVSLAAQLMGVKMNNVVIKPNKESFDRKLREDASKKIKNVIDVISLNGDGHTEDSVNVKKELIIDIEGSAEVDFPEGGLNAGLFKVLRKCKVNIESQEVISPSNKVTIMSCKICEGYFSTPKSLSKHMKKEHKDEKSKSFTCDICDKQFSRYTSLWSHNLLHTAGRFECEFCDYVSAQKGNLKTHRIKKHKEKLI